MRKRYVVVFFCGVMLAASVFIFGRPAKSDKASQPRVLSVSNPAPQPAAKPAPAPEHIYYNHLFHHIAFLNKKAADEEAQGRDGSALRTLYQRQMNLSEPQSRALDEVALNCVRAVARQDEKAKRVIDRFRARYPEGRVPTGEQLPPPPPELQLMQEERDLIILRARNRLRGVLGEQVFSRVDRFVKKNVMIDGQPTLDTSQQTTLPTTTQRLKQRALSQ